MCRSGYAIGLGLLLLATTPTWADVIAGPTLTMDPNGETPLAGVVELETDVPSTVKLHISDGADNWNVKFDNAELIHYLPVLGLKPDRTYSIDVNVSPGGPAGVVFATTPPLPADYPTVQTTVSIPSMMEPGYTFVDCITRPTGLQRYSMILDSAGEVVWYTTRCIFAGKQLPNGNLYFREGVVAVEMDLLANETRLTLQDPGIGLHHDLLRTPNGTYLSLNQQLIDVLEFPTSETDPAAPLAPTTLLDDSVVEFFPDGTLRREWPLFDMIDPTRIAFDSLELANNGGLDWTHANAVNYRFSDDSIIVSIRHQDAVIKFSRKTGDLQWILGPHDNWSPAFQQYLLQPVGAPFLWQFHQHAPMWTASGSLLLFDNGNFRTSPFDGNTPVASEDNFSRGVEFVIDENLMEVQQVWEYGENVAEPLYAFFISDADEMVTTGNRLIHFGGTGWVNGVAGAALGLGSTHTRIIETTNDLVPVEVFAVTIFDPDNVRTFSYRSERIPSLYPTETFKAPNGVGNSVAATKQAGVPELSWLTPPIDTVHGAAEYYIVYGSSSASGGFIQVESTAATSMPDDGTASPVMFYKLVAANLGGTSGDEPTP